MTDIPHAVIPIIDEYVSKNNVDFFALGGKADKEYYINKKVIRDNIRITNWYTKV